MKLTVSVSGDTISRPLYRKIPEVYPLIGRPPVVALTATATPEVRRDITSNLELDDPLVVVRGFDRPNITWSVSKCGDVRDTLAGLINGANGSGILYVPSRRSRGGMGRMAWYHRGACGRLPCRALGCGSRKQSGGMDEGGDTFSCSHGSFWNGD